MEKERNLEGSLMRRLPDMRFPGFTTCFLSDGKSVIHLQVELAALSLSCRHSGVSVLKAELKSINEILA